MAWCSIALYDVYLHAWYIGIVWSDGCEIDDAKRRSDDDGHGEIGSTDSVKEKMIAIVLCGVVVRASVVVCGLCCSWIASYVCVQGVSECVCVCAWGSAWIASVCVGECLSVLFVSMGLSCSAWGWPGVRVCKQGRVAVHA